MNLGEIRNLVRIYLNEPTATFWTDATLNTLINVSLRKVHNRIKSTSRYHFTTRATFPTISGTEYYSLPTDCKDLKMVTRLDATGKETPLAYIPWPDPTTFTPTGFLDPSLGASYDGPLAYWVVGQAMRLLPRPAAVVTMKIYYESRLTDLSADVDLPSYDADYHDMAAKWAAIEAGIPNNNDLDELKRLFKERDEDMIQDVLHRVPAPSQEVESYLGD